LQILGATLARELGPHAITVNSLCIGVVDTSRIDDMRGTAAHHALVNQQIPLRRMGTTEEIGEVVVFLCSESGAYITGQSINVDGGFVIH
jgi:3-oxoacyl-[acyl-carrier protein] reductase